MPPSYFIEKGSTTLLPQRTDHRLGHQEHKGTFVRLDVREALRRVRGEPVSAVTKLGNYIRAAAIYWSTTSDSGLTIGTPDFSSSPAHDVGLNNVGNISWFLDSSCHFWGASAGSPWVIGGAVPKHSGCRNSNRTY